MHVRELKDNADIKKWFLIVNPKPNTIKGYLLAMQHYTDYTGMTPGELIDAAELEIKSGKLMREREILFNLVGFRDSLQKKNLAPLSIKHYMAAVRSFYKANYIEIPLLPGSQKGQKLQHNKKVPDKEVIRQAINVCNIREKAILLCGLSSGMGAAEISSLTLKAFYEGYDKETGLTLLDMRREKVGFDFITFLTPEATRSVMEYLQYRDRPTRTGRQVDKDIQAKQKTTPDSYLFIREHVPNSYLKTHDEEIRQLKPHAIVKMYGRVSNHAGLDSRTGVYNLIRSHNMRKWFNSTLKNAGCESDIVEYFMGHTLSGTKDAYYIPDIEKLKGIYSKFVPYLTVQKELDVSASAEYKEIVKENDILRAETARHIVERTELSTMRQQMEENEKRIKVLTEMMEMFVKI
ncbi:MAG: tyrosine-type recombinase/integrase [Methanomethylovorans sp.]|uniref:tyrosine-type recombinase/integrase n=1 Tax=Methanomethylovorans sp. TaxID=2758717 RepID=UPI000A441523|nr:tyrosine-type recombinase/integrase [Methanomethylovorans sp.]